MRALSPRHRSRWYAYTAVTTVVVLGFAIAEWGAERYISDRSRVASTLVEIGIVLLATLVFQPFHRRVEAAVESAFMRRRRQALEALSRFRRELTSYNDVGQLLRRVIEAVEHHMEAAACAVYLRRDVYRAEASSFETPAPNVDVDDPLAVRLRSTGTPAQPATLQSAAVGTIAFPMTVAGDLIGFVCVHARYGEYEPEEMQGLGMLVESLGIALSALDPYLRRQSLNVPNNLPAALPPLIGRGDDVAEIKELLNRSRLVTLTGAGGVGKTRLALHVASEMRANPDGIWFVDLAPIDDPALLPSAIAAVFDIADEGGDRRLIERVGGALQARQLLIVLDNCEHLIGAAASAVEHLLQTCPRVQFLATSREPLGLSNEEPYRVPSLPAPPPGERATAETIMSYAGVALFVARARTAQRDFELTDENAEAVADIVRRLDGIAMALELAAPRLKVLSVEQLRGRLDERFKLLSGGSRTALPRHQTLHALIGWSYDLLNEPEKALLRRSAIFRADWSLEAAEAVCSGERESEWSVIDLLEALVDKSLIGVQTGGESRRYRLLESTRQFALERLDEANERAAVALRYGRYFAGLAERTGGSYWQSDSDRWTACVREDLENYRGAIACGLAEDGEAITAAAIVAHLRWFWYATARREGHDLVTRATAACKESAPAEVCGLLALCTALLDTSAQALAYAQKASSILVRPNDPARIEALTLEGLTLGRAGRLEESRSRFDEAAASARAQGEPRLIGWVLSTVAYWYSAYGEAARASELFDEAAQVLRASGDAWQLARLHVHRAEFLFTQADLAGALSSAREAQAVFRARYADTGLCVSLLNATAYLLAMGRFEEAWESAREGLELALRIDNAPASAWAIGHLAELAAETGDVALAARLLGYADSVDIDTGGAREPTEQRGYDRAMHLIRERFSEKEIFDLMAAGATATRDAIAREATSIPRPRARAKVLH
jgi:predicted ATPase